MRILFLTNNSVSEPLLQFIGAKDEVISRSTPLSVVDMQEIRPDLVVSYSYHHLLRAPVLEMLPQKFINLHISLLPNNRGSDPNIWAFLHDTPKGVTIHIVDEGLDTGPILVQREVRFDEQTETLSSTYARLHTVIQDLFREHWEAIRNSSIRPQIQTGPGITHSWKEFAQIKDALCQSEGWDVKIADLRRRYGELPEAVRSSLLKR